MTRITQDWIDDPALVPVFEAIGSAGGEAYFVGGCVRNALLDLPVADVDIATSLPPEAVAKAVSDAGLRFVETGLDHGTITVLSGTLAVEITTYRTDVETDGRHATVAYTRSMDEDAKRRDFTMNALYADQSGDVIDPLNGLPDLRARRVRFIGDAIARIAEDYLRILRYFRFHAIYGDSEAGFDEAALDAIARSINGLDGLSRERVGAEMCKLLGADNPTPEVSVMAQIGVLSRLLAGADPQFLGPLVHLEGLAEVAPDPIRRLAALGGEDAVNALRLSKAEARQLATLLDNMSGAGAPELAYHLGAKTACDVLLLRGAMTGTDLASDWRESIAQGSEAVFPISAADLMPEFQGPELGAKLAELEKAWISSEFTLDRAALLGI